MNEILPQLQRNSLVQDKNLYDVDFDPKGQSTGEFPEKSQGLISHDPKPRVSCEQSIDAHTGRRSTGSLDLWWRGEIGGSPQVCSLKEKLHEEPPQDPGSRYVCYHRITTTESNIAQGNTSCVHQANTKVHSQPSTERRMPHGNNQLRCPESVSQPAPISTGHNHYMLHRPQSTVLGTASAEVDYRK